MPGAGEYSSPGPADYVPLDHEIGHEGTGGGSGPNGVPIDGGAGWLLAAGAGYGIKRLRDRRKQKGEETSEAENGETEIDEQQQEL